MTKYILCFSGGKDSTAMLITLLKQNKPIDDILYIDTGDWMWKSAKQHLQEVESKLSVNITRLDVSEDIRKGFERWGFPSMLNRWCTGIKRDVMGQYIKNKYGERESMIQYIGYCADEIKRLKRDIYVKYKSEYPLVDAGITTSQSLEICKSYGFTFGGVYEHHSHYNCWMCPLQTMDEVQYIHDNMPQYWEQLRNMQYKTDGYYNNGYSIFDLEKKFWTKNHEQLRSNRMNARKRYNKRGKK